jgi:hypothetical protein
MTGAPAGGGPLVSVLVPSWNAEQTIERALDSVLADTTTPLEVIVVDDASTDGTTTLVDRTAARDARVRLIRLEANGGVSAARNRALEAMRGEWLTFLDADDRFRPGALDLLRGAAAGGALAVVGQQVWSDGRRTWLGPLYDIPDIRTPRRTSLAAAPGLLYYVSPHGKLFHRSIVGGLRFEGRVLGDQPWIIRALLRAGDRIEVLGDTVYEWIRAAPRGARPSITTGTRSSVGRGVEAVGVAGRALAEVAGEVEATLTTPADRLRVQGAYTQRLLRSDLAQHVARAVSRGDPEIGELLDAVTAFVDGLPPAWLAAGDALAHDIVVPTIGRLWRVTPAARPAVWALSTRAVVAGRADRLALALARPGRPVAARWLGLATAALTAGLAGVGRRLRTLRPA